MYVITIDKSDDNVLVTIHGDFDAHLAKDARSLFSDLAEKAQTDVVVDMSKVDFVDSSGIGALIFLHKRLRCKGLNILLRHVQAQPMGLFALLRIDQIMTIKGFES